MHLKKSARQLAIFKHRPTGYAVVIEPRHPSPFIEPVAVETWDAWFRWRDDAGLRDISIEDTWRRVAAALASVERPGVRSHWQARFAQAFAAWQLLPDERVLASAGTGSIAWRDDGLYATLNAAAFVRIGAYHATWVDLTALDDCAELAVRALDNAALLAGIPSPWLRVGLVGAADVLMLLGLDYDSPAGRAQVVTLARALAAGCFRANVKLAMERGCASIDLLDALTRALSRGMASGWVADAERHGLRYPGLTAITSQPRLALLANNVADALDPVMGCSQPYTIATPEGQRIVHSAGYARSVLLAQGPGSHVDPVVPASVPWTAQIAMRAAVQPWMDEPIACPLLQDGAPSAAQLAAARQQAAMHGLGLPEWRSPASCPIAIDPQQRDTMHACDAESMP